jgi:DNA-binding response OmpR family regulator
MFVTPSPLASWKSPTSHAILPSRVLVLDGEPLILWSLCTALAQAGYDAVAARNEEEARRVASEWPPPRVAVLDILPGEKTARLIRDLRRFYADCRFIVLSTDPQDAVAWKSRAYAASVSFVAKPFDVGEILRLVGDAIPNAMESVPILEAPVTQR